MANLLGGQFCIESLRRDVSDLQTAITDVFSRAGPVVYQSWKYPDKKSNEVNISDLLELYDFSEDEEDNQVAHIVLLELVVDRMVLLLQSLAKYLEQTLALGSRKATAMQSSSNTSIGLVVKKYWNKMVQAHTLVQQLQSENKTNKRKMQESEDRIRELEQELQQYKTGVGCPSYSSLSTQDYSMIPGSSVSRTEIARDESSRPSQTVETAFVPCEACHRVQHCLKEIGGSMNRILESQELPCSLLKFQSQIENLEWMTSNDVGRWCAEQNKDLARINKHFEYLTGTIEPLKEDLAKEERKNEDLEKKLAHSLKELKSEKNTQTIMQKQFQVKLKEVERQGIDSVDRTVTRNRELERDKQELEKHIKTLHSDLEKGKLAHERLESMKKHLENELHDSKTNNKDVEILQLKLNENNENLNEVKKKLKNSERELSKERAKTKSLSMHSESVQGKQGSMLQRIDDLDRENETLRDEIADLEDMKEKLEERLDRADDRNRSTEMEYKEQKVMIERLAKDKDSLEQTIQDLSDNIKELEAQSDRAKENERLLIMYPDLNGPVNPDISGTGDIVVDMDNQVKANSRRIMILEEQNGALRNSISKVKESQKKGPKEMLSNPVPLWRPPSPDDGLTEASPSESSGTPPCLPPEERITSHPKAAKTRPVSSKHKDELTRQFFTVGKSPVVGSTGKKFRPPSGTQNSSFHAYLRLKSAGMIKPGRDPPHTKFKPSDYVQEDVFSCKGKGSTSAGKRRTNRAASITDSDRTNYKPQNTFTCTKCDKIYNSKRDLEIHATYCYGGL